MTAEGPPRAEANAELQTIFWSVPALYFRVMVDGTIVDFRPGRADDLYLPPERFVGRRMSELLPESVGRQVAEAIAATIAKRVATTVEYPLTVPSGEKRFEAHLVPYAADQAVMVVRDISDQHQALEAVHQARADLETRVVARTAALEQAMAALRESEERFRALAENSPDVTMRFDRECRHLYASAVVEGQTGIPARDFIGKTHRQLGFPEALCELWEGAITRVFTTGQTQHVEFELPTHIWIDWLLVPEFAADRSVAAVMGAARDISARKHAQEALERRVAERTAELAAGNAALHAEIAERERAKEALRESELHFRTLAETTGTGIAIIQDECFTYANPAAERLTGYTARELTGMTFSELVHPDFRELVRQRAAARLAGARDLPTRYEIKGIVKGGAERWFSLTSGATLLRGKPALAVTLADTTEEHALRDVQAAIYEISEATQTTGSLDELFRSIHAIIGRLMDARNFYIALHDPATNLLSFPYFVDEVDTTPEPFSLGRGMTSYVVRSGRPLLATPDVLSELEARGEIEPLGSPSIDWLGVPLKVRDRIIGVLAVQSYAGNVRYSEADKEVLSYVSTQVAQAIERKRAEEALRESEDRFRDLVEQSHDLICTHDLAGRFLSVNPAAARVSGYSINEILAMSLHDVLAPEVRDQSESYLATVRDKGAAKGLMRIVTKSGEGRIWEYDSTLRIEGVAAPVVRSRARDVTDRIQAEDALRQSEEKFRVLFENMVEGFALYELLYDDHGQPADWLVLEVNDAYMRQTGVAREQIVGRRISEVFPAEIAEYLPRFSQVVATQTSVEFDTYANAVGRYQHVVTLPAGGRRFANTVEDITERVELEGQLRQAQKMEAVGSLAGGVAHDFNNVLQTLLSLSQALAGQLDEPERFATTMMELQEQVKRGAALTRQLLLFSRSEPPRLERLDLNEMVKGSLRMLRRLLRENISFTLNLAERPIPTDGDVGQLEQVLLNLVVNAADAMPEGGRLVIRTHIEENTATLEVSDTGSGMTDEVKARIFEPFYTTKEASKGTGLGLSVAHGIITGHGGHIEVKSVVGQGSTFRLVLPAAASDAHLTKLPAAEPSTEIAVGGGERVLLVEDEAGAREGLVQVLTMLGYRVTAVGSGSEAGALPAEPGFDALLTDYLLPDVLGTDLAVRLKSRWPRVKVVLISGYAEDDVLRRRIAAGEVRFLQKPFDMEVLARELRAALDEA
jgi:PAS domain S-box-containing protein